MKVVILAAGLGSRLDNSENHQPKTLTKLANGKSILEYQIEALAANSILPEQIFVVVGYQKEAIIDAFPDLTFVYNPDFEKENTAKSLLRALTRIEEDVLWLNGDVVFHPKVIGEIFRGNRTSMIVNTARVGEEEVKYRATEEGKILEVSKKVIEPQGEALGINFFKRAQLPLFRKNLEQCSLKDYFEKGIEVGIQQGQSVWAIPVEQDDCAEIDFPADLERANRLVKKFEIRNSEFGKK
jgi:L-glutamine-phosphate cytidylyltransferase